MKKITIAIPTYNRNETLNYSLLHLLPQLTEECHLIILDDHSPRPVVDSSKDLLNRYPNASIEIRRNRWNIGLVANVLRCFEYCQTPWIWVPGDDDLFHADAIQRILTAVNEHPQAHYFNFLTQEAVDLRLRDQTSSAKGLRGFAIALDFVGQVNFMSCSVWNTETFGPHVSVGFEYAYSNGWSFALLLSGLGDSKVAVFSDVSTVITATTAPMATRWSYRKFILGWATLLEIPSSEEIREILATKMLSYQSPETVAAYLLADSANRQWPSRFLYYDLAVGRLSPHRVHSFGRLRFALYRPLFLAPKSAWRLVKALIGAANRMGLKKIDLADLEGRAV